MDVTLSEGKKKKTERIHVMQTILWGVWERMDTCICTAESLYCTSETITLLIYMYAQSLQSCLTLRPCELCPPPQSMGFSRHEYWSGLPCPPPGHFLTQELNLSLLGFLRCRQNFYCWTTRVNLYSSIK